MNSGFVSENDLGKRRRRRKEDWEKVQESSHSHDATEESHKSLHDKVQERKEEYEDPQKSVMMLLNSNEEQKNTEAEQLQDWKQKQEILDYRNAVEMLRKDGYEERTQLDNKFGNSTKSQNHLKKCSLIKKTPELPNGKVDANNDVSAMEEDTNECCKRKRKRCEIECDSFNCKFQGSGLTCIGILPGLGSNIDSSDDSDQSCSSGSEGNENAKYDLLGRSIVYESKRSTESR